MGKTRFVLDSKGVRELMKSQEMQSMLAKKAKEIADRCGDGYESDIYVGKNRANASISAATKKARKDNLDNNTLLKAALKG